MGRPVVHWELWSKDPERISDFYGEVFSWKVDHMPELEYRLVKTGGEGGIDGGILRPQEGPWPGNMTFYIHVEDLDDYRRRIESAGGKIIVERQEVPGMGAFSLFEDPDGRVLGIWQQGSG